MAGIIGGNGSRSSTLTRICIRHFYGIAPQANLVSVRVLDQNGMHELVSTASSRAFQWVVANQKKYKHPGRQPLARPSRSTESYTDGPAVPGRRGRLEGRPRRRLRGRQQRPDQRERQHARPGHQRGLGDQLREHPVARKRPQHHHGRRDQEHGRRPGRRPHRHLLQPRPIPPGPGAEARHHRARQQGHLTGRRGRQRPGHRTTGGTNAVPVLRSTRSLGDTTQTSPGTTSSCPARAWPPRSWPALPPCCSRPARA